MRPLLFLDVDGTLLAFGGAQHLNNPELSGLEPALGARLLALPCELTWATAWMDEANEVIAPLLGLPELPVAGLPEVDDGHGLLHWKTRSLVEIAAGRPFVWVDDEISDVDRDWVSFHHAGQALLHRVNPAVGLTDADFAVVESWLRKAHGEK